MIGTRCPAQFLLHVAVPTVFQSRIHNQEKMSTLSTYVEFFGNKSSDVASVLKSLIPRELQQLGEFLPEKGQYQITTMTGGNHI